MDAAKQIIAIKRYYAWALKMRGHGVDATKERVVLDAWHPDIGWAVTLGPDFDHDSAPTLALPYTELFDWVPLLPWGSVQYTSDRIIIAMEPLQLPNYPAPMQMQPLEIIISAGHVDELKKLTMLRIGRFVPTELSIEIRERVADLPHFKPRQAALRPALQ
jgi:hypothetical protein